MALILNLETATTVCSVALAENGQLLALKEQDGEYSHAENLTLFIEDVMKQTGAKFADIDAVAVSKGPGSYTGLRIGVSTAKGLCYSLNKPLIAIDTLQHLSLSLSKLNMVTTSLSFGEKQGEVLFCPMIDARRMEVYCAIYDSSNALISSTAAQIIDEYSFAELLKHHIINFFGSGASKCKEVLAANKNAVFVDGIVPSAADMITLSEKAFRNEIFVDVAYFEPFYLKDFIAGKKKKAID